MKQKVRYVRTGTRIFDAETNNVERFPSINAAKRKSRQLQAGALGNGLLIKGSK